MSLFGIDGSTSVNGSTSNSSSTSHTYGNQASAQALANMQAANEFTEKMWEKTAKFNAEQSQIQREWQERMANTNYQRTVKDMISAGINPILAAGAGLGADTVGSGSSASISSPSSAMAGAYPESIANSEGASKSWGSSESGLATGLKLMSDAISGLIGGLNSSITVNMAVDGLKDLKDTLTKDQDGSGDTKGDEVAANVISQFSNKTPIEILDMFMSKSSPKRQAIYESNNKNLPSYKNYVVPSYRINEPSWTGK